MDVVLVVDMLVVRQQFAYQLLVRPYCHCGTVELVSAEGQGNKREG